ncbi:MAG: adenylate/guanylate cyclase domain-containing protein [Desulfobulbaceae bacterium]|nr:adenylate/guanylate cyclase domain-containing protein [Desulfobulbaceae bacterium]HIJ78590.1 adenylate/guanylate cyclase domain-containing protein [Deltaproteobacteria bacterium]
MGKKLITALAIGLLAALVGLFLRQQGLLAPLEFVSWQYRVAHFAEPAPSSDRIRIIALDQQSLDWGSRENGLSWPWPRQAYEVILSFCNRAGAKVVAFDLLFSEPSLYGLADDAALVAAMQANGPVVLSYTLGADLTGRAKAFAPSPLELAGFAQHRAWFEIMSKAKATLPVDEIACCAALLASISGTPDQDGIFRRMALFDLYQGQPVPSLALAAYLAGGGKMPPLTLAPGRLRVGDLQVPLDRQGKSILNFRGPSQTIKTVSAAAIIQAELQLRNGETPAISPAEFNNAYVFFGLTAPGLFDLRSTPLDAIYPGVEIHATALDNLLNQDFLQDAPLGWTVLLALLWAGLAAVLVVFCQRAWQSALLFVLLLPLPLVASFVAYGRGWWLPVAVQDLSILLALVGGLAFNFATEGRKKRYIKMAFGQYLHPTVINQLLEQPDRLRLGGEKRELSIFFADLQSFTRLSEQLDPERLTLLLNEYLTAMTDIIMAAGGTIDKYEGDAVLAFWNAPLAQPDHADRAVRAALRCQARLAELRPGFAERFGFELFMRVGINTGTVLVGNLGSNQRFDYSILGDGVNVAARLEGVNKEFGTPILISAATRHQLSPAFQVREVGRVKVVGRQEPLVIFEPVAEGEVPLSERLIAFEQALAHYYQGDFAEALAIFTPLAQDDAPANRYVARCRTLLANPPLAWHGVWEMTSK